MSTGTEREDSESDRGPDQYWKRRAIALGAVLGAVGLMAWACGAGGGEEKPVRDAAALAGATPTIVPMPAATSPTATATASRSASPKPRRKAGDACVPHDVVVTLAASASVYAKGRRPELRLTVVNTGSRACAFDVGSRALDLRISSGPDRVWTASQCAPDEGSGKRVLRRGVPFVRTIVWDRRRGSDGCRGHRPTARPGTYVAEIHAKGVTARRQVFSLR
ncbi:hypothetical protein [Actinomadura atramentaria]|uniref:hypothetical protein n=1 Tax=Actinomadura atramentaria TaxID=1990 RepID=UPI00037C4930|nr:hypothetical protein [Actinomadura atramentaria]